MNTSPDKANRWVPAVWTNTISAFLASTDITPTGDPTSYKLAMSSAEAELWLQAMKEEIRCLIENGTWELTDLPEGRQTVKCKWVYLTKHDTQGNCYVSFLSGGAEIRKGRRLQLIGCAPDVLLVLSICGSRKTGVRSEMTWSKDQSQSRRCGRRRSEDTGSEVRNVGELEKT
jgi:hypothetical protein